MNHTGNSGQVWYNIMKTVRFMSNLTHTRYLYS